MGQECTVAERLTTEESYLSEVIPEWVVRRDPRRRSAPNPPLLTGVEASEKSPTDSKSKDSMSVRRRALSACKPENSDPAASFLIVESTQK